MELSIDDILRMPRESAGPLLERMVNKSRHVRNENQTLAAQVRTLQADKAALEEQLENVMRTKVEDMPPMNFGLVYSDHEELVQRIRNQDEIILTLQAKNDANRTKLKARKQVIEQLRESQAEGDITGTWPKNGDTASVEKDWVAKSDHEQALNKLALKRAETKDLRRKLKDSEKVIYPIDSRGVPVKSSIDPIAFLKAERTDTDPLWPASVGRLLPIMEDWSCVRPDLPEDLLIHRLLPVRRHSIILQERHGVSSALLVFPRHTLYTGKLVDCEMPLKEDDVFQLVFQAQNLSKGWLYAGLYECVFSTSLPSKHASFAMTKRMREFARNTIFGPYEKLPGGLRNAATSLLDAGLLEVNCFGIRRIGYDLGLEKALQAPSTLYRALPAPELERPRSPRPKIRGTKRKAPKEKDSGSDGNCEPHGEHTLSSKRRKS